MSKINDINERNALFLMLIIFIYSFNINALLRAYVLFITFKHEHFLAEDRVQLFGDSTILGK